MVDRFSLEKNGNMIYIAEDYRPVTSCFDSYDRTDLQKIVNIMNNLNQCYFDEIKKNGELTIEIQRLTGTCNSFAETIERLQQRLKDKDDLLQKELAVNSNLNKRIKELEDDTE